MFPCKLQQFFSAWSAHNPIEERRLAAALPAPAVAAAGDEENVPAAYAPKTPRPGCGGRDAPWSLL